MNIPLDRSLSRPAPPLPALRLDEATAVPLGAALTAVYFDRPAACRGRIEPEQDGTPIPPPYLKADLGLAAKGVRHVLLIPQSLEHLLARHLLLRLDDLPAAEIDPAWLQPPQGDMSSLIAGLTEAGIHRLLRAMLTTGRSLFAQETQTGLAEAAGRLMDQAAIPAHAPVARCDIAGRTLVSYAVAGADRFASLTDAVVLAGRRLIRLNDPVVFAEGKLLHMLWPEGIAPARFVAFPDAPLRLDRVGASVRHLAVTAWLEGRSQACREWLTRAAGDAVVSFDSEATDEPVAPSVEIGHLSSLASGVLYALHLKDPSRVVERVVLERRGGSVDLTPSYAVDGTALLVGYADLPGSPRGGDLCRISALLRSGRMQTLAEAPLAAYDSGVPAGFEEAWHLGIDAPYPLARARAAFRRAAPPVTTHHFGPAQACGLRIITSIGSAVDMIRARAAMIFAETEGPSVEVVCTMADGPLALGARNALAQAAAIYGIAHRLVLLPAFATEGERLRAALAGAMDVPALILGADVLPADRGWLAFWHRRLRRQAALAPALLATDGSIAATREGHDPCRGLPAGHLPTSGRPAARPLAACLAAGPAGLARLAATETPHPDPATWFAAALSGRARTETRFPFRRFGPAGAASGFAAALADAQFALIDKDCE